MASVSMDFMPCSLQLEQNKRALPATIPVDVALQIVAVPDFLDGTLFGSLLVSEASIRLDEQREKLLYHSLFMQETPRVHKCKGEGS